MLDDYVMAILVIIVLFLAAALTLGATAYFVLAVPVRKVDIGPHAADGKIPSDSDQPSELAA